MYESEIHFGKLLLKQIVLFVIHQKRFWHIWPWWHWP